jgi:muconate cycloisomerase
MKITGLETIVIELPCSRPYSWRSLQSAIGRYAFLRVEVDDGLVGIGEAPVLPDWGGEHGRYFGEDTTMVAHLVRNYFAPLLIGTDPRAIKELLPRMDVAVHGFPYTKAMIEVALFDLAARAAGVPVYQLLGGAARLQIPVCHSLGLAAPDDAAREAADVVTDGIQMLQIKVRGDHATDVAVMKAVRRAVGDAIRIYPDVNRGYRTPKEAIAAIAAMHGEANICMVEQPVEGADAMAQVTAGSAVPVIVDEGCWSPQDAVDVVRNRSADAISIYFTKSSGLLRSMQIGAIARGAGLPVNVNGSLEAGVGNAANLHLAAALEGNVLPAVIAVTTLSGREQTRVGGVFYTDDIIAEPFHYADGCLTLPSGPGLGVDLDPRKIEKYRVA